jgi:Transposase, Mutator family
VNLIEELERLLERKVHVWAHFIASSATGSFRSHPSVNERDELYFRSHIRVHRSHPQLRTIFYQPDHATAMAHLKEVAAMLRSRFSDAADLLEDAADDILAFMHFPQEHRRRLHSTNPLERLHKEIKRRTNVIGIFPSKESLMRLVTTLLEEQDDEWQVTIAAISASSR